MGAGRVACRATLGLRRCGLARAEPAFLSVKQPAHVRAMAPDDQQRHHRAKMRAKGIKKSFLKRHMRHEQYLNVLRTRQITHAKFLNFQSKRHRIYTVEFNKVCLSAYDDKRFVLKDGVGTLPHGHFKLRDPVVRATL